MRFSTYAISLFLLVTIFCFQNQVYAECGGIATEITCDTTPPNPSLVGVQEIGNDANLTINVLPGAGIDTVVSAGGQCISTGNGNNTITVNGGNLNCQLQGIQTLNGNNNILVVNSNIVSATVRAIRLGDGNDVVEIRDSFISGTPAALSALDGDDTVKLGTGADVNGFIDGGLGGDAGFDTLVFEMEVFPRQIISLCAEIQGLNPEFDSITIDGFLYEWLGFDVLVCDLKPKAMATAIPTLSEWGLIAMAGILGILGFMVIRKRKVNA